MKKTLLIVFLGICFFQCAYTQKTFHVKITLDTTINPQKLQLSYFDGKNRIFLPDTFQKYSIELTGNYYSQLVPLNITYPLPSTTFLSFFISNKPAQINLHLSLKKQLKYSSLINSKPIWDSTNVVEREIKAHSKKSGESMTALFKKYGNKVYSNDSINIVFRNLFKSINKEDMSVIKQFPDDFFSRWYFRDQILELSEIFQKGDTVYLKSLLSYFKSTFPPQYVKSVEGKALIEQVEGIINPPLTMNIAPEFKAKDIGNKEIDLRKYRGKYVLLDFWATWCAPCMDEVPFIKKVRNSVSKYTLILVGVSWDRDLNKLKDVIKEKGMDWPQIFDRDNEISNLYGIPSIPHVVLINKKGVIVYDGMAENGDRQKILNILKGH